MTDHLPSAPVPPPPPRPPGLWARFRSGLLALSDGLRAWVRDHMVPFLISGLVFTFLVVYLAKNIFIFVDPGQAGVLFHRLTYGTELDRIYGEGMHIIAPWNQMYIYNMRVQARTQTVQALSSNGLMIDVTVSMRYYPEYKQLPLLHQKVGPDYETKIVEPEVITGVREVIGKYRPEDLYTLKTSDISDAIIFSVARRVNDKFIVLDAVNVMNIRLPDLVTLAIEKKLTQEQVSQEYEFRIKSQQQEAQRLSYEAQGIANYNRTIDASVSPNILKYKGIDATLQLATSANAKVVVIGAGNQGLPLILNDNTSAVPVAPRPADNAVPASTPAGPATVNAAPSAGPNPAPSPVARPNPAAPSPTNPPPAHP
jgi:regulator of protease activity HflC (stomatin/prohibitin superfamily)